jgi:hypothetical protein
MPACGADEWGLVVGGEDVDAELGGDLVADVHAADAVARPTVPQRRTSGTCTYSASAEANTFEIEWTARTTGHGRPRVQLAVDRREADREVVALVVRHLGRVVAALGVVEAIQRDGSTTRWRCTDPGGGP